MQEYWHVFLLEGVGYTLLLSFITVFFGTIIGAFLALGKMSRFKLLRGIVTAFVEIIRGTPDPFAALFRLLHPADNDSAVFKSERVYLYCDFAHY